MVKWVSHIRSRIIQGGRTVLGAFSFQGIVIQPRGCHHDCLRAPTLTDGLEAADILIEKSMCEFCVNILQKPPHQLPEVSPELKHPGIWRARLHCPGQSLREGRMLLGTGFCVLNATGLPREKVWGSKLQFTQSSPSLPQQLSPLGCVTIGCDLTPLFLLICETEMPS